MRPVPRMLMPSASSRNANLASVYGYLHRAEQLGLLDGPCLAAVQAADAGIAFAVLPELFRGGVGTGYHHHRGSRFRLRLSLECCCLDGPGESLVLFSPRDSIGVESSGFFRWAHCFQRLQLYVQLYVRQ